MRATMIEIADQRHLYLQEGEGWANLGPRELIDVIRAGPLGIDELRRAADRANANQAPPDGAARLAPLIAPSKILAVGVNYRQHAQELPPPWKITDEPFLFLKAPSAIIGPDMPIMIPRQPSRVDYEVELAVVIGTQAKDVPPEDALKYVFGYTIINDVTERGIQATDNQLAMSKGIDTFCPQGPCVVLTDEIPDPSTLSVSTYVNGELRQDSTTADLIFSVPDLVSRLSALVTLEPGDIIMTGTPSGCGAFRNPPVYLEHGDRVTVTVDGIGEVTNPVREKPDTAMCHQMPR